MMHYTHCPICEQASLKAFLKAKDHTVSQEEFTIVECNNCGFLFTQDVPDSNEIGKYYQSDNYISHSDTRKNLFFKIYNWVRNYTLKQKHSLIHALGTSQKTLLDVGSGTGYFPAYMKSQGWTVSALEPSDTARAVCEKQHQIIPKDPSEIYTLPNQSFEVITLWHVLEHVHDLNGYFKRFFELLNPGGYLIIAVPNPESQDAQTFGAEWAAWDVPRHLYHFTPGTMKRLAEKYHFEWKGTQPMWFDSLYVSMLSKEIQQKTKWLGIVDGIHSNIHAMTKNSQTSSLIYVLRKPSS
jgi:2-polyprenyl-3-methyl-5-hydroxy-6-metoxy-1,4-benzoquinol methylase